MPQVKVKEGEPFDVALRRFKRGCETPLFGELEHSEVMSKFDVVLRNFQVNPLHIH